MQRLLLFSAFMVISCLVSAQDKKSAVKDAEKMNVAKEGSVASFESVLSDGKLSFTKLHSKNSSGGFNSAYYIRNNSNTAFNSGKPFEIKLDRGAFDTYFKGSAPELAQKYPQLLTYAQDRKLSFSDEQTWISVLNYYNSLK